MKQLPKLLADNRGKGLFKAEVASAGEATIYLYDTIVSDAFFGGVSAQDFVTELFSITADVIHLRINSPGGDVFAARAMEQAVREHPSKIIAHVDGYAASAASYLALAADEVHIAEGGFFMIHRAWTIAWGNAEDLLSTAELLEKVDETLVKTYAAETNQDVDQILAWMSEEKWFNAEEAVTFGFADKIADSVKASATWNLSAYEHAPKALEEAAPAPVYDTEQLKRKLALVVRT